MISFQQFLIPLDYVHPHAVGRDSRVPFSSGVDAGLKKSAPGSAWLHKNVTKAGSRLRMV